MKYVYLTLICAVCLLFTIFTFTYHKTLVLLNPLSSNFSPSPSSNPPFSAWGFLPYWNLNKFSPDSLQYLTDLAYFAVTLESNGNLINSDLGYRRFIANYPLLRNLTHTHHLKLHLVIKATNDQALFNFLDSDSAQQNLLHNLERLQATYPVDGYNLDFEPDTATNAATRTNFTEFVNKFRINNKNSILSVDIYPSAATSPKLWDLKNLEPLTDNFIVMSYDYTRANSSSSGPVAPTYPQPGKRHALIPNLKAITEQIPRHKLLIGLPLYGYEWDTSSPNIYAPAIKQSGRLATYDRIDTLIQEEVISKYKNPQTLSSRLIIPQSEGFSQIYFEDLVTYLSKIKFVESGHFGGIALWALGYEGKVDIWSPFSKLNLTKSPNP